MKPATTIAIASLVIGLAPAAASAGWLDELFANVEEAVDTEVGRTKRDVKDVAHREIGGVRDDLLGSVTGMLRGVRGTIGCTLRGGCPTESRQPSAPAVSAPRPSSGAAGDASADL